MLVCAANASDAAPPNTRLATYQAVSKAASRLGLRLFCLLLGHLGSLHATISAAFFTVPNLSRVRDTAQLDQAGKSSPY
jgi:hypothetical protein